MLNPIIVGRFGKSFGMRGWIKVISFTSPERNILDFSYLLIKKNNFWEKIYFEDSRERLDSIVVKLPNCNSLEEASNFTNIEISVHRKQLPKLDHGEYYWADLVGLRVINLDGVDFGIVRELIATGSNDVLVVVGERKRLIPYLSYVIYSVDLGERKIYVDWMQDF